MQQKIVLTSLLGKQQRKKYLEAVLQGKKSLQATKELHKYMNQVSFKNWMVSAQMVRQSEELIWNRRKS